MSAPSANLAWQSPSRDGKYITGLKLRNSFVPDALVEFIPEESRKIKWYCCGPTVYDVAHLGHARTYVACDTIRSILRRYFGYHVELVINVTDIDDKIIQRANFEGKPFDEVARYWEAEFWDDMRQLGIDTPDLVTRVSEFVPEIIAFVQRIIDNGFAYESQGSVYFDISAFTAKGHTYAKLEPTSFNDVGLIAEAEGVLGQESTEKRSPCDFALWKCAKRGEPAWDSPWGRGRPGWHIECSAMCANAFGESRVIDIHSGGVDLRFPHHDNEVAQSEAFSNRHVWVNYFIHFGHLHIQGLKMSKSLKNFISIKELLKRYNRRQLRLLFLMSRFDSTLNYNPGPQGMAEAIAIDEGFFNFFSLLNSRLAPFEANQKLDSQQMEIQTQLEQCKSAVHEALLDNFDTPKVINLLSQFCSSINGYLNSSKAMLPKAFGLGIKSYIYSILDVLKLVDPGCEYGSSVQVNSDGNVQALVGHLVDLRTLSRILAQYVLRNSPDATNVSKKLLAHCDALRDEMLPQLGVVLEDTDCGNCVLKYKTREEIEQLKVAKEQLKQSRRQQQANSNSMSAVRVEDYIATKYPGKFSKFDDEFLPTHLHDGTLVSKSERGSLKKLLDKHRKLVENTRLSQNGH